MIAAVGGLLGQHLRRCSCELGRVERNGRIGSPATVAALATALIFIASSCAQSASSTKLSPPSVAPNPTPAATPPPGGPVPADLLGDWFLPPAAVEFIAPGQCPSPPTAANCFFRLSFAVTTYHQGFTTRGGMQAQSSGDVVVNGSEIDFFNGVQCGQQLPDGIGRYTWTVTGGILRFVLISDPCGRSDLYTYGGWSRTH